MFLTFDDINDMVSASANTAWADIARRIPMKSKTRSRHSAFSRTPDAQYSKQIHSDRQVFEQCTDTSSARWGHRRMGDEFSSFARMPKAAPETHEPCRSDRDATVLQRVFNQRDRHAIDVSKAISCAMFDRRLITQAVTNLVKNASEESMPETYRKH